MDPTDRQILTFETKFFRHYGAKVSAARDELGLSEVGYWQRLNRILDAPGPELAVEFGPLLARLARMRAARLAQKIAS